jgi:hydrogenase maturation protein HypF
MLASVPATERAIAERQLESRVNAPLASSMGRLFDAAAAAIGVRLVSDYEGQAAMELEALAGGRIAAEHPIPIDEDGAGGWQMDPIPLLTWLALSRQRGVDPGDLAADFHASIAWVTELLVSRAADATGISTVVLGGGVFQNARLLASLRSRLERRRFRVLLPRALPPNDGAISYGQAAMAAAILSLRR